MDAQSVDETTSTVLGAGIMPQIKEGSFYTVFSPGVTAGVVQLEGAHRDDFTGTWANLATITFATADTAHRTNFTGCHMCLRARISTAVAGGTVSVVFVGN